ncbi:MAG TPA: FAD binding domain-containing protein, partial [Terriglobales bacterium]|nr:FAD binding domain-containing protein [Terriglobales bacterium]
MYIRPKTLDEAVRALAREPAQVLSGGTDFYPALCDRPVCGSVVDVSGVAELRGVTTEADRIRIGG